MNAVNLIPADARGRRLSLSASRPTLGLLGGMLVVLAAAVVYVSAVNTVTTRRAELARVTAATAGWTAAANSYTALVQTAQQRALQLADVRQLVAGRYAWSQLLSQIGGLMPATAALSSLQATTTPGATPTAAAEPTVALSGCAASQSTVAETMVQLRRVTGVTGVTLSSSTDSGTAGASGASGASSGSCPYPVQFQVSLIFAASSTSTSAPAAPAATSSTAAAAPTTTGAAQ